MKPMRFSKNLRSYSRVKHTHTFLLKRKVTYFRRKCIGKPWPWVMDWHSWPILKEHPFFLAWFYACSFNKNMIVLPIYGPVQIETNQAHIDYKSQYENIVSIYGWSLTEMIMQHHKHFQIPYFEAIGITDLQSWWIKRQAVRVSVFRRSNKLSSVTRYSNFPVNKKKSERYLSI